MSALNRAFEDQLYSRATIAAIMAGNFAGSLLWAGVEYSSIRRPGILPVQLHEGTWVSRRSHPDMRIATASHAGVPDRGKSKVGLTEETLGVMFENGMVVKGSEGHARLDAFVQDLEAADRARSEAAVINLDGSPFGNPEP